MNTTASELLRTYLEANDISPSKFAADVGVSVPAVYDWLRGGHPHALHRRRVLEVTGIVWDDPRSSLSYAPAARRGRPCSSEPELMVVHRVPEGLEALLQLVSERLVSDERPDLQTVGQWSAEMLEKLEKLVVEFTGSPANGTVPTGEIAA